MSDLIVKEVQFNGDTLVAVKNSTDEKVYVGVKWVCEGLGFTDGQARRQKQNMAEDTVLQKGITNLHLPSNGGSQESLAIELTYLPLWLAKISITPKMKREHPEVTEKLIQYQLRVKDILADAFIEDKFNIPQTFAEALRLSATLAEENEIMKPKAESFDLFLTADNAKKMNAVAKSLKVGRNKLFKFLRESKVLIWDNLPYQKYVNDGYFSVREITVNRGGYSYNGNQTLVTAKGVNFIGRLLRDKMQLLI